MVTFEQKQFIDRVIRTLRWRMDVDSNEMIERRELNSRYCKDHLFHPGVVTQKGIESICEVVNDVFFRCCSNLLVSARHKCKIIPDRRIDHTIGYIKPYLSLLNIKKLIDKRCERNVFEQKAKSVGICPNCGYNLDIQKYELEIGGYGEEYNCPNCIWKSR